MSLRISSLVALIPLIAACGAQSPPPPGDTVDCAIGAGADLEAVCTLEQVAGTDEIVIHHPDGGFRRFARSADGAMLMPLDGAEPLVPQGEDPLQFSVDEDRYAIAPGLIAPAAP
jgi:hypothetical protein